MIIVQLLLVAVVVFLVLIFQRFSKRENQMGASTIIRDPVTLEGAFVRDSRLIVRSVVSPAPAFKSFDGLLWGFGSRFLPVFASFDGAVVWMKNENRQNLNFFIDFFAFSWADADSSKDSLANLNIVIGASQPTSRIVNGKPVSLNPSHPNTPASVGLSVYVWDGIGEGMQESVGGNSTFLVTMSRELVPLHVEGRIIISPQNTIRFDVITEGAGRFLVGAVGWFSESI